MVELSESDLSILQAVKSGRLVYHRREHESGHNEDGWPLYPDRQARAWWLRQNNFFFTTTPPQSLVTGNTYTMMLTIKGEKALREGS